MWVDVDVDPQAEIVLFNSDTGLYHALDPIATAVWRSIAGGDDVRTVVEGLNRSYGDDEAISRDVCAFVEQAIGLGLLVKVVPLG